MMRTVIDPNLCWTLTLLCCLAPVAFWALQDSKRTMRFMAFSAVILTGVWAGMRLAPL